MVTKERYEQKKIDRLQNYLKLYAEKGHPIDFEVLVDGFKAVRRTSDPEMFTMYEEFVDSDTRSVEFLLYTGNSNNNHKHIFYFGNMPPSDPRGLDGPDVDERVEEGVQQRLQAEKYAQMEKDNKDLQNEINDLEKEVAQLEKEKAELLAKQSPLNSLLGDVGSSLVESFIRRNPKIMSSIPGGEALAGLIEPGHGTTSTDPEPDAQVSFQPRMTVSRSSNDHTGDEAAAITFVSQLKARFTKDEFDKVMIILETLADDKSKIDLIIHHVKLKEQ